MPASTQTGMPRGRAGRARPDRDVLDLTDHGTGARQGKRAQRTTAPRRQPSSGSRARGASATGRRPPARSGNRGKPASRSRKPQRRGPGWPARLVRACVRLIRALWLLAARGLGVAVRALGHPQLDTDHRRDGLALGVLAVGLVEATGEWGGAGGPLGGGTALVARTLLGAGVVLLPVLLVGATVVMLRRPADPAVRGRLAIGWSLLALGCLGLVSLADGLPTPAAGWAGVRRAGGVVGYAASAPLQTAVTQ